MKNDILKKPFLGFFLYLPLMISLSLSLASKPVFLSLSLLPLILATDDDLEKRIENSGKKYLFCEIHRFPHIETSIIFIS